jgi:phosphatidylglycerophosphate synthase
LSAWYFAKAAACFGATMLIALRCVRTDHPFARFGPANQVTSLRALFVALVAACLGEAPHPAASLAVAAAAIATTLDGVDGWLARRTRMVSAFGARFDLEVDALLIQTLSLLAWRWGKAGAWVLMAGLMRYLFAGAGWVWPWMRRKLRSTWRAKSICILQIASLIIAVMPDVDPPMSAWAPATGLTALSYSFFVDIRWLWTHRHDSEGATARMVRRRRDQ